MVNVKTLVNKFIRDESGATAIEYGLFAALIAAVIVATVVTLGLQVDSGLQSVSGALPAIPD